MMKLPLETSSEVLIATLAVFPLVFRKIKAIFLRKYNFDLLLVLLNNTHKTVILVNLIQ